MTWCRFTTPERHVTGPSPGSRTSRESRVALPDWIPQQKSVQFARVAAQFVHDAEANALFLQRGYFGFCLQGGGLLQVIMYNPWPNPGPRVPVFSGAPHPQPGAPRSYLSTPTPAISRRNAPMQAPNPGLWGHQHVGLPPGPPVPIPAVAAQLSMHWNVNITTRHQRDHVVRAGQAIAPGWRFTNLTVDSGDPEKTVGLSPLALLPRIYTLDLKCGWWNWEDLSRLPGNAPHLNMMQACESRLPGVYERDGKSDRQTTRPPHL